MTTGYICAACGETFTGDGRWLQSGYHGGIAPMQWWDLCPECMDGFAKWLDCYRESAREHSLESESVREQSESVRERRYESQDVTGSAGRVTEGGEMSHDTREKLEAAAQTAAGYIYGRGFTNGLADAWNDDEVDTAANQIIQLLDRQAAITERECMERIDCAECAEGLGRELDARCDPLKARIAELCDQVDELTKQRDDLRIYRDTWEHTAHLHEKDIERLVEERDQWKDAFEDSERMRLAMVVGEEIAGRL